MKRLRIHLSFLAVALIAIAAASPAAAQCDDGREGQLSDVAYGATALQWRMLAEHQRVTLTVAAPCGLVVERTYEKGEDPLFDLRDIPADPDGRYHWQLRIDPAVDSGVAKEMAAAHASGSDGRMLEYQVRQKGLLPEGPFAQSGSFEVIDGSIVEPSQEERSSGGKLRASITDGGFGVRPAAATDCPFAKAAPAVETARIGSIAPAVDGGGSAHPLAFAAETPRRMTALDQVIPDDLIVQGSLCVGFDCVNNESFGFDTIRLKENNLRIKFEDTSVGTFPTNDWQLTANDSASGGASKFSIEDITGAKVPFTVRAGAATNSVFVDSIGRVGFRTSTPVLDLHVSTSNTPGIRLEQTAAGGFTAQTWDIAGNEANFFVRDVTGGSRLPFRVRPGAPTSSIDISADGDVGVGTASPDEDLHVTDSDGTTQVLIEETSGTEAQRTMFKMSNNGPVTFLLEDRTGFSWDLSAQDNGFVINRGGSGVNELRIDNSGNLFVGGTQMTVPDYVFSPTYELMPIAELKRYLETNRHLPNVPNAAEITSGGLNLTQFPLRLLEKVEELTLYTIEQEEQIAQLEEAKHLQDQTLQELRQRMTQLEMVLQANSQR